MRDRMLAVGCGGLVLLLSFLVAAVTAAGVWQNEGNAWIGWVLTAACGLFALLAFAVGVRRTDDEEDPFEGNRGLAMGLTIVVFIAVTAFAIAMFLQGDFWRGAMGHSTG